MAASSGFIDPPGPFAPAWEWRAFLEEMKKLPKADDVDASIKEAEAHLASIAAEEGDEDDDFADLEE